jgi:hypothetical protein
LDGQVWFYWSRGWTHGLAKGTQREFDGRAPAITVRSYNGFSEALTDIRNARIYGGMHYENSTLRGADLGQRVAQQLMQKFFQPTDWRKSFPQEED